MFVHPDLNIIKFDSVAEFGALALKDNHDHPNHPGTKDLEWRGGLTMREAATLAITGDDSSVAKAEKLMSELGEEILTASMIDMPSVAGGYCCVPEALAGEPECMRESVADESAPLHILVGITAQSNVTPKQMHDRGIAILALVMHLSATRPVTLDLITGLEGKKRKAANGDRFGIACIRVNTAPLDLASAAFALTHPSFARSIAFSVCNRHFGMMSARAQFVGAPSDSHEEIFNQQAIARYLEVTGEYLMIPGAMKHSEVTANPIKWLHEKIAKFCQRQEFA